MTFTLDGALHIKYISSYAYTVLSLVRKVLIKPELPSKVLWETKLPKVVLRNNSKSSLKMWVILGEG